MYKRTDAEILWEVRDRLACSGLFLAHSMDRELDDTVRKGLLQLGIAEDEIVWLLPYSNMLANWKSKKDRVEKCCR